MHHGQHQALSIFVPEEHGVREATKQTAPNLAMDLRKLTRCGLDPPEQSFDREQELVPKPPSALFVPVPSSRQITADFRAKTQRQSTPRTCRLTSAQLSVSLGSRR